MLLHKILRSFPTLVAVAAVAAAPLVARAADVPSYASHEETIKGTIVSLDSQFGITVRDERGYLDKVTLHPGTIINPTGLRLAPGQSVTILGRSAGSTFAANEIDTPYDVSDAGAGGSYYSYAAPYDAAYPYGYGYGGGPYYGNSSLAIGIGGGFYPSYGYYGGGYYSGGYYNGGYYQPPYYRHGYDPRGNGGHGVTAPYHTYPYQNPAPPAAQMPRAPQPAAIYHGFGGVRAPNGNYRGFGGAGASGGMSGHH